LSSPAAQIEQNAADARKVRDIVAKIIEAIDARGDDALREYSAKFANWESSSFHLSESDIDACFAQMSKSDIDDIRFAQAGSVSA